MDNQYLPHSNIVRPKKKLFAGNSLSMKGATDCGSEVSRSDQIEGKYCGGKACDFHRLGTQRCPSIHDQSDALPSYGSSKLHYSFQNSLLAAVAALCLIVYYCHENHLCHPHLGAPPKWDSCTTKMGQDRPQPPL